MNEREQRLQEIRARLDAATPGKWLYGRHGQDVVTNNDDWRIFDQIAEVVGADDGDFIAHAPEDIAFLLAALGSGVSASGTEPQ